MRERIQTLHAYSSATSSGVLTQGPNVVHPGRIIMDAVKIEQEFLTGKLSLKITMFCILNVVCRCTARGSDQNERQVDVPVYRIRRRPPLGFVRERQGLQHHEPIRFHGYDFITRQDELLREAGI